MGRRPHGGHPKPQGLALLPGNQEHPGEQRLHLYAQPGRWRPEDPGGAAEHLLGAACLCDQFRTGPWAAVLQQCHPALCGQLPEGYGALQAAHHQAKRGGAQKLN